MTADLAAIRSATAGLFGDLWHRYDDPLFEESVGLFGRRFEANGFDLRWFRGKRCLDIGCGGGRYTVAMARLGARLAVGCDISTSGLTDAARRAEGLEAVRFLAASALGLPSREEAFDFVCCSGVLHHTPDPELGLRELARVLRPGGRCYLLLYGTGGLRWPTVVRARPFAQALGYEAVDRAIQRAGLPANKQRTFLDDLFVPIIEFFTWDQVREMLSAAGLQDAERWERGKLDHEESVSVQRAELEQLRLVFEKARAGAEEAGTARDAMAARDAVAEALAQLDTAEQAFAAGRIDRGELARTVFGEGHHRVLAVKGS
ncbi:MAG: class I SAM-dependent methyltransferase [Actinomycetota bacterium]|nr:class I SAM-dependent methyltransferase [Actinomycetota bacterium]